MRYWVVGVVVLLVLSMGGVATTDSVATTGDVVTTGTQPANDIDQRPGDGESQRLGDLQVLWTSDPEANQTLQSNHHTPAAVRFRNETYVAVPINSRHGTVCALAVLDGDGDRRWRDTISDEQCTVHAVSDPAIADYDADDRPEVLAATSEQALVAYNLTTGTEELRRNLTSYGYSKPIVADLTGGSGPETVVVDLLGGVFVLRPDGNAVWHRTLDDARVRQPGVADYDADGQPELVVGQLSGPVTLLERDGATAWRTNVSDSVSTRWLASGRLDRDPAVEVVVATYTGHVVAIDGASGAVEWTLDLGPGAANGTASGGLATNASAVAALARGESTFGRASLGGESPGSTALGGGALGGGALDDGALLHGTTGAAVHAVGDGDGDGDVEVYPVARNGKLYGVSGANGSIEWTLQLADPPVGVAPPPSMGDVDADGDPELVAVTDDGTVAVVDPTDGSVLATYARDVPIRTFPRIADVDGDAGAEMLVLYGDGRVVALSYGSSG